MSALSSIRSISIVNTTINIQIPITGQRRHIIITALKHLMHLTKINIIDISSLFIQFAHNIIHHIILYTTLFKSLYQNSPSTFLPIRLPIFLYLNLVNFQPKFIPVIQHSPIHTLYQTFLIFPLQFLEIHHHIMEILQHQVHWLQSILIDLSIQLSTVSLLQIIIVSFLLIMVAFIFIVPHQIP